VQKLKRLVCFPRSLATTRVGVFSEQKVQSLHRCLLAEQVLQPSVPADRRKCGVCRGVGSDGITSLQRFVKIGHVVRNLKCRYGDAIAVSSSNVLFCVDGTHVLVPAPASHKAQFVCYKEEPESDVQGSIVYCEDYSYSSLVFWSVFGPRPPRCRGFVTVEFL